MTPRPRAVAIVLGPLGATESMLERYATWYRQRSCIVITGASPPGRFVRNASLQPTAIALWQKTLQALRNANDDNIPVVVHMFSNGGAFVWEQMDRLLSNNNHDKQQQQHEHDNNNNTSDTLLSINDRKFLTSRLTTGYLLFDSCPCYIRTVWDTSTPWNASFPHPGWGATRQWCYTAAAATSLTFWLMGTLSWSRPTQFWQQMTQSTTCPHHVYVYTTTDLASDATAIDRLVAARRQQEQNQPALATTTTTTTTTKVYRYEDSSHCRIDHDHPEEYQRMIDEALEAAIARNIKSQAEQSIHH